jgi:Zn-dependent protease
MGVSAEWLVTAVVMSLIPMILSLSLHEWGHAKAAVALGDDTPREQGRLTLNPVAHIDPIGTLLLPLVLILLHAPAFGWARPVQFSPRRFTRRFSMATGMMLTAAAGPGMNLLIALVAALTDAALEHFGAPLSAGVSELIGRVELMNIILALVNLLPVPPLDGSRVLAGVLPGTLRGVYSGLERYSAVFVGVLFVIGARVIVLPSEVMYDGLNRVAQVVFP